MTRFSRLSCLSVLLIAFTTVCPGTAAEPAAIFESGAYPGERVTTFKLEPEVRVRINTPATNSSGTPLLIFYALPNGNTIEQTEGRRLKPGDDWRFGIQHIAAQTRFLRKALPDRQITLAYLEAAQKSWPAWRKEHGNEQIPGILESVARAANCSRADWVLTGHSGGGSLTFGYLNTVENIPPNIVRIAFLDSNYAYDPAAGHTGKLLKWVRQEGHFLAVLAYNDAVVSLNGKPIVSPSGGTWGRSNAMWNDMAQEIKFTELRNGVLRRVSGLSGRLQFWLLDNPDRKILHTTQVERNGFIHAMLCGTSLENKGYLYFGKNAWEEFVESGEKERDSR